MIQAARLGSAVAGFVFAIGAVILDDHRVAWAAIALLGISLLIRIVTRGRPSRDP